MSTIIFVSANDEVFYKCKVTVDGTDAVLTCGRCNRGTVEPKRDSRCTVCPAKVEYVGPVV